MKHKFLTVTLIGSVKQEADWRRYVSELTKRGYVVFEAGLYGTLGGDIPSEVWELVTQVHFQKIQMSDMVATIRKPDGTIGDHTRGDMEFGKENNKRIFEVETLMKLDPAVVYSMFGRRFPA